MRIIKTERIALSAEESKAWDLMIRCLERIVETSENPEIQEYANEALDGLGDLTEYLEEDYYEQDYNH